MQYRLLGTQAMVADQILNLNDRFFGKLLSDGERKHTEAFHNQGKPINQNVRLYPRVGRALIDVRKNGADPFESIEAVVPWDTFTKSVSGADQMQSGSLDHLHLIDAGYNQLRRYAPRSTGRFHIQGRAGGAAGA